MHEFYFFYKSCRRNKKCCYKITASFKIFEPQRLLPENLHVLGKYNLSSGRRFRSSLHGNTLIWFPGSLKTISDANHAISGHSSMSRFLEIDAIF